MRVVLMICLLFACEARSQETRAELPDGTVIEGLPEGVLGAKTTKPSKGKKSADPSKTKAESVIPISRLPYSPKTVVANHLKENTNDPSKFEIIKVSEPTPLGTCYAWTGGHSREDIEDRWFNIIGPHLWQPIGQGAAIRVKYRSANAVGATVLSDRWFAIDLAGQVIAELHPDDFQDRIPQKRSDPNMDALLKSFGVPSTPVPRKVK